MSPGSVQVSWSGPKDLKQEGGRFMLRRSSEISWAHAYCQIWSPLFLRGYPATWAMAAQKTMWPTTSATLCTLPMLHDAHCMFHSLSTMDPSILPWQPHRGQGAKIRKETKIYHLSFIIYRQKKDNQWNSIPFLINAIMDIMSIDASGGWVSFVDISSPHQHQLHMKMLKSSHFPHMLWVDRRADG